MELYDENVEEKKSKAPMIIGISIIILVIITGLIIYGIFYLKETVTKTTIDGQRNTEIDKIYYIETTEESNQIYFPIIKMAQFLGYKSFNGDYLNKSEDKNKCHAICKDEVVIFTRDSDNLIKITNDSEIEYIVLDKLVFEKNGELYTTIDGVQKAFNVIITTDEMFKNVNIVSMDYMLQYYATKLQILKYSTKFSDKKAIFENMIIIKDDNGKYGVVELQTINNLLTTKSTLETKYEDITYLPVTKDFIVKSNGKYGIVTKESEIRVNYVYDEIKTIDNQNGLYLVKQNGSYGIIDIKGNVVIAPEYKQIGINIDKFKQNGVDNKYVLLNEIIPIQNNKNLWALFRINGQQITEFKYTGFGCTQLSVSNSYPALVVPSNKIIIALKDKHYTLVTVDGQQLIPDNTLNSVYIKTDTATQQNQFFMTYKNNEKIINVEEWLSGTGR